MHKTASAYRRNLRVFNSLINSLGEMNRYTFGRDYIRLKQKKRTIL